MRLSPERANLREGSNSWHRAHLRQLAASPARRHTACVRTVSERTHESHDHLEPARTYLPAVPSRPRGVVVPRLERAATVVANTVRGAPVRTAPLHTTAAADRKSTRLNSSHTVISYA